MKNKIIRLKGKLPEYEENELLTHEQNLAYELKELQDEVYKLENKNVINIKFKFPDTGIVRRKQNKVLKGYRASKLDERSASREQNPRWGRSNTDKTHTKGVSITANLALNIDYPRAVYIQYSELEKYLLEVDLFQKTLIDARLENADKIVNYLIDNNLKSYLVNNKVHIGYENEDTVEVFTFSQIDVGKYLEDKGNAKPVKPYNGKMVMYLNLRYLPNIITISGHSVSVDKVDSLEDWKSMDIIQKHICVIFTGDFYTSSEELIRNNFNVVKYNKLQEYNSLMQRININLLINSLKDEYYQHIMFNVKPIGHIQVENNQIIY